MRFHRLADNVAAVSAGKDLDPGVFPGVWINSNPDSMGFSKIEFDVDASGHLTCRVQAIGPAGNLDWGYARDAVLYAAGPMTSRGFGFSARYDFDFLEVQLQGNLNKGLMVLATFNRFKDGSGRCDYFLREYFAVTHGQYA